MSTENEDDIQKIEKDLDKDEEQEIVDPLSVSDDDFVDIVFSDLEKTNKEETTNEDDEKKEKDKSDDTEKTSDDLSKEDTSFDDNKENVIDDKKSNEDEKEDLLNTEKIDGEKSNDEQENTEKEKGNKEEKENSNINYADEHKKLLAPFRANNKEMQVSNVEEARTLMQMGANYNKKMAGLKPSLKIVKMLQNNDLLDENKISYLIDLDKKNPEAVKKFIKESGIDPLELDLKEKSSYKPDNTYTVDDKEVELDGILDEIKDTKSFNNTIDIIGNKWDESSKSVLRDNPGIIKVINEHVATGIYDKIDAVISKERALGKLVGLSDIEAYKQVGDAINAAGGFDNTGSTITDTTKEKTDNSSDSDKEKKEKKVDPKLRDRKKAASSTQRKPASKDKEDFNPLSLSDEDFEKVSAGKY